MFKRFTERARKVIILAREEAEHYRHEYLGTEHILLGVLKDGGGIAIAVLQKLGVDPKQLRLELERNLPKSLSGPVEGDIPFTPKAKKVLEYAVEEARLMGHNYIGTEHLLLGIVREKDGLAAKILASFGVKLQQTREQTINLLREPVAARSREKSKTPALDEFGRDLTEFAEEGKLDPVIGRGAGNRARHPDSCEADEKQPRLDRRARRRKNGDCRGSGPIDHLERSPPDFVQQARGSA